MDTVMTAERIEVDDALVSYAADKSQVQESTSTSDIKMTAEGVNVYYDEKQALDWTFRLREINILALPEPHE